MTSKVLVMDNEISENGVDFLYRKKNIFPADSYS